MEFIRALLKKYEELQSIGDFGDQDRFVSHIESDGKRAEVLISHIVGSLGELEYEWEAMRTSVLDLDQEEVIKIIPSNISEFVAHLQQAQARLVMNEIVNRIRFIRKKYVALEALQPLEQTLQNRAPGDLRERMEFSAILSAINWELGEVENLTKSFPDPAAKAFEYADSDRLICERLMPINSRLFDSITQDYYDACHWDLGMDIRTMSAETLTAARQATKLHKAPFSPLTFGYIHMAIPTDDWDAYHAREFLGSLLSYWSRNEESIDESWGRTGRDALPLLEKLVSQKAIFNLFQKSFFKPEQWAKNLAALRPVTLAQNKLDASRRHLLRQIYTSFVFGQWSAVFALSRAALEHAIKDRLKVMKVPLTYSVGKISRNKTLDMLIGDLLINRPDLTHLKIALEEIQEQGNKALHQPLPVSGKESIIDAEHRFRAKALEVVFHLKSVLEAIYVIPNETQ